MPQRKEIDRINHMGNSIMISRDQKNSTRCEQASVQSSGNMQRIVRSNICCNSL
jgi:hypothetical protein